MSQGAYNNCVGAIVIENMSALSEITTQINNSVAGIVATSSSGAELKVHNTHINNTIKQAQTDGILLISNTSLTLTCSSIQNFDRGITAYGSNTLSLAEEAKNLITNNNQGVYMYEGNVISMVNGQNHLDNGLDVYINDINNAMSSSLFLDNGIEKVDFSNNKMKYCPSFCGPVSVPGTNLGFYTQMFNGSNQSFYVKNPDYNMNFTNCSGIGNPNGSGLAYHSEMHLLDRNLSTTTVLYNGTNPCKNSLGKHHGPNRC